MNVSLLSLVTGSGVRWLCHQQVLPGGGLDAVPEMNTSTASEHASPKVT